eukprot:4336399-Prymnesium_polylepis.2
MSSPRSRPMRSVLPPPRRPREPLLVPTESTDVGRRDHDRQSSRSLARCLSAVFLGWQRTVGRANPGCRKRVRVLAGEAAGGARLRPGGARGAVGVRSVEEATEPTWRRASVRVLHLALARSMCCRIDEHSPQFVATPMATPTARLQALQLRPD